MPFSDALNFLSGAFFSTFQCIFWCICYVMAGYFCDMCMAMSLILTLAMAITITVTTVIVIAIPVAKNTQCLKNAFHIVYPIPLH